MSGRAGFDAFLVEVFNQYEFLSRSANRPHVIVRSQHIIRILRNYPPQDEGEEINVETFMELFQDLIARAGGTP